MYWPGLQAEVEKKREAFKRRWEEGGKKIGEYEEYLRGGDHVSLQQELDGYKPGDTPQETPGASQADLLADGVKKMGVGT